MATMSSSALPIEAVPAANQHITHEDKDYTTVREGLAYILIPSASSSQPQNNPKGESTPQSVFYNPIQQFNRDLSVLAIKAYGEELMERKQQEIENKRQRLASKKKDKKRKREDLVGDGARKAGKLDGEATILPRPAGNNEAEAVESQDGLLEAERNGEEVSMQLKPAIGTDTEGAGVTDGAPRTEVDAPDLDTGAKIAETAILERAEPAQQTQAAAAILPQLHPSSAHNPTFTILDALSATGLRALRYAQEIPFATSITANDLLPAATKTINRNIKHNRLEGKIRSVTGNAITHMYNLSGDDCKDSKGKPMASRKYNVIDLDPYGTAAPFLDAAIQAVRDDGGLLCITCTDAGVWASNGYPEKAFSLYGGIPIKGQHSHEGGLRLILHAVASSAARYGLHMEALLSLSIDFYARVFVRIHKSAADVKFLAGKTMVVYNCDTGCGAWKTQTIAKNKLSPNKSGKGHFWKHVFASAPVANEHCAHCGLKTHMAGPMYGGPLHSPDFIKKILSGLPELSRDTYHTLDRIEGMLTLALEETLTPMEEDVNSPTLTSKTHKYDPAVLDHYPFFFIPSVLAKVIHCITPHENALRGALRGLGYRATRSHTKPGSIKTDASWDVIWAVMREWAKQKAPIKEGAIREGTAGWTIMGMGHGSRGGDSEKTTLAAKAPIQPELKVVFDEALGKEHDAKKLVRYQINPRENWGPMNRANGH